MNNTIFKNFIIAAQKDERVLYDPQYFGEFTQLQQQITEDVKQFDAYTLDGQFDDILVKVASNFSFDNKTNYYNEFLNLLYDEFQKLVVPTMILVPLNNFHPNFGKDNYIEIADNIRIYQVSPSNVKALEKYHSQSIYAKLLKEHILTVKDPNFFNNPIMTILVKNVPFKVNVESARISEAVYSLMRMVDFTAGREGGGRGLLNKFPRPAGTYCVYYNTPQTSPNPPYDNGYGYSFRFKFDPILDINSSGFMNRIERFEMLIHRYVSCSFINKNCTSSAELSKIHKWLNAVLLYNSAYELASKEKFDESLIVLLTILESLFLKNTGNKKKLLADYICQFLNDKGFDFEIETLVNVILDTYNHRSKFIHEGKTYFNAYAKGINDKQGVIPGMKPFSYGMFPSIGYHDAMNIQYLFCTTGHVLMSYFD